MLAVGSIESSGDLEQRDSGKECCYVLSNKDRTVLLDELGENLTLGL